MKLVDAVTILLGNMPRNTQLFFDNYSIVSLSRSGTTVTATTSAPHNLKVNQYISILNALVANPIVSLTQSNGIATAETQYNHDLTEGWQADVVITGANQAAYNGSFPLLTVPNRKTFTFAIDPSAPGSATGALLLDDNNFLNTYNGFKTITSIPTPTTFTYELPNDESAPPLPYSPAYGTILGRANHRIAGFLSLEIASEYYNEKNLNSEGLGKYWLACVLDNILTSKSRFGDDDAVNNTGPGEVFRERLINQFSCYVFAPLVGNAGTKFIEDGRKIMDNMSADIMPALIRSIGRYRFPNPFAEETWSYTAFTGYQLVGYNNAFSIHRFTFENTMDVTFPDTVPPTGNVAFRDVYIDYVNPDTGLITAEAYANLDEVPLPEN